MEPINYKKVLVHRYCTLFPLKTEHASALYPLLGGHNNAYIWDFLENGPYYDIKGLVNLFQEYIDASIPIWVVLVSGQPLGYIGLKNINSTDRTVDLGPIVFSAKLQRTCGATAAIFQLLRYVFSLGFNRVQWCCDALHNKSVNSAKRLGFIYEGTLRNNRIIRDRIRKTKVYSMLSEEWQMNEKKILSWLEPTNFDRRNMQIVPLRDCKV